MKATWVFLFLLLQIIAFSQDSSITFLKNRIEFDISGKGYWQGKGKSEQPEILLPEFIRKNRSRYNGYFNRSWRYAEDNPMYHAAYFIGAHSKVNVGKGLTFYASLFAEHRGFSYGTNTTSNIVLFPQLKAAIDRKFKIGARYLHTFGSMGNQINPRLYEGLTIYNMYQQGHNFRLRYGKFQIQYTQLNDLINGIGLYIDETYDVITSLEELKLNEKWKCDIRAGHSYYALENFYNREIWNFSTGIYIPGKVRIYGQVSYRPTNTDYFKESEKYAGVLGVKYERSSKRVRMVSTMEFRYYGAEFNAGFRNSNVYYRSSGPPYANTVGSQFYPLLMYDRPFSQWAVFTEYQNGNFYNVGGASITADLKIKLHEEITLIQFYDFNYIGASNGSSFLYPFYHVGLGWEPVEDNMISAGITNKGMNLDLYYPTHYLFATPTFMMKLERNLKGSWFGGHD